MLFDLILAPAYLLVWLLTGWGHHLPNWYTRTEGIVPIGWWTELMLVGAALSIPYLLITLPLSYFRGYALPHRYGLSTQHRAGWVIDVTKGLGVSFVLGVPLMSGFYALLRAAPGTWWLWAAAGYTLVTILLTILTPVLLLPIFYEPEPLGNEHEDLKVRLLALAKRAGTEIAGIYRIDMSRRTTAANAAITGLGRTRRILLADTLLNEFEVDEIETILAHELGHHVNRDISRSILFQAALNLAAFFLLSLAMEWAVPAFELGSPADPAGLPFVALLIGAFGLVTMPAVNTYSRSRERMADRFAIEATGKPNAFAEALTRLANQNLAEADPERWVVWLLSSHPPLRDRIELAEQAAARS